MRAPSFGVLLAAVGYYILAFAAAACIPDLPSTLLSDARVLQHEAVVQALKEVQRNLSALYENTTRDGLSFAIVHASSPNPIFTFNNGTLRWNETDEVYQEEEGKQNKITSDSIFRIISASKNIAMASAIILISNPYIAASDRPRLSLDTPVRLLLPEFALPEKDWRDGGSEITLRMLASHTAGIPRESYSTGFNMILSTGKADAPTIGKEWAGQSAQDVIDGVKKRQLMFAPGQRAAYSNAGIGLLGAAVAAYYNNITGLNLSWSNFTTQELLKPLKMTHSFFGAVPQNLMSDISIPGGSTWADLVMGEGYDPAAGMWSSANDLSSYLYHMWLSSNPLLISKFHQRDALKPVINLPDGVQQSGPGWEIELMKLLSHSNSTTESTQPPPLEKTYSIFGKSGNGGGWASWIDTIPNLGYGIVVLTQASGMKNYQAIAPTKLKSDIHAILSPAFITALSETLSDRFAGRYMKSYDSGLFPEQVLTATRSTLTYARLEVQNGILYLRELVINGTSALEAVDKLSWTPEAQPAMFSTTQGVVLEPAEGAEETAQFGPGARVWRMMFPGLDQCDWFDFDGYQDSNGWPVSKVVLVEKGDGVVELHYPPFDVVISRT